MSDTRHDQGFLVHSSTEYSDQIQDYSEQSQVQPQPKFPRISWGKVYPIVFFSLVLPGSLATLIWFITSGKPQTQTIQTPYSQSAKLDNLAQSTELILSNQNQDAQTLVSAAETVLDQQRENLLNEKVIELSNAIAVGRRNQTHQCYQKTLDQCLDLIDNQIAQAVGVAVKTNNLDELLKQTQLQKAVLQIRQGRVTPAEFNPNLYKAAIAQQRAALAEIAGSSPDGRAAELLNPTATEEVRGQP